VRGVRSVAVEEVVKIIIQFEAKDVAAQKYAGPGGELASWDLELQEIEIRDISEALAPQRMRMTITGIVVRGNITGPELPAWPGLPGSSTGTATTPKRRRGKKR